MDIILKHYWTCTSFILRDTGFLLYPIKKLGKSSKLDCILFYSFHCYDSAIAHYFQKWRPSWEHRQTAVLTLRGTAPHKKQDEQEFVYVLKKKEHLVQ